MEDFRLLNRPPGRPTGGSLPAKKHLPPGASLGTGEVWIYHVSGGGGVQVVERANEQLQKELGEPVFRPRWQRDLLHPNTRAETPSNTRRIRRLASSRSSAMIWRPAKSPLRSPLWRRGCAPHPRPTAPKSPFVRRDKDSANCG